MTVAAGKAPGDVGRAVVHGTMWMVAMRWAVRGLGLVNTFILARLLLPSDFGLVAMAMLVISLVEVLGSSGQLLALIRHPNPTRAHYDSVWTLTLMIALLLTAVLLAVAPLASLYFHEPRAGDLVRVLALRTFVGGFDNIGTVTFRKNLAFGREFTYQVLQRLLSILATIFFAWLLRDYWALALGILFGRVLSVILGYVMHPYRPRLAVSKIPEMWSFSGWTLLVFIAQFLQNKADEMVLGGFTTAATFGTYSVAADVATAPTIEVAIPMTRALFPIFARIADDKVALRTAFLDVFAACAIICAASATGVSVVAPDFVAVALGPKWHAAVPLVEILAFSGGFYGVLHSGITLLNATGHAKLSATIATTRMLASFPALIAAAVFGGVKTIAMARLGVTAVFMPGIFIVLARVLPITVGDMLLRVWRPMVAAALMAGMVRALHPASLASPGLRLGFDVMVGAVSFTAALAGLWALVDCPPGPEASVMGRLRTLRRRPWRLARAVK